MVMRYFVIILMCLSSSIYAESLRDLMRKGDYEAVLQKAEKVNAERLRALHELGNYDQIIAEYGESEHWPDLAVVADAYRRTGKLEEMSQLLARAIEHQEQKGRELGARDATAIASIIGETDINLAWNLIQDAHDRNDKYVDAYLVGAQISIAAFAWQYALEESYKVYKMDKLDVRAITLAARAMISDNKFTKASELLDEALGVNERYVPALNLKALLALQKKEQAKMQEYLERAQKVNPRNDETLALLAASSEMAGDKKQRDIYVKQALSQNAQGHKVFAILSEAAERRYLYNDALHWGRRAQEINPKHWQGDYIAAINLLRLGEETEGYKLLDQSFKKNPFNVWAFNMLTVLDEDFKDGIYVKHETKYFAIKIPKSIDAQLWPYLNRWLDPLYDSMAKRYQFKPTGPKEYNGKILLLFFDKHGHFSARTVGLPGLGANGATFGQVVTMPMVDQDSIYDAHPWYSTLEHEIAHVFTIQKTKRLIPRWLTEGISEWQEQEPHIQLDGYLMETVLNDELPSLDKLSDGIHYPKTPMQIGLYYYLSAIAVEQFVQEHGEQFLNVVMNDLAGGMSMRASLEKRTEKSLEALDKSYHAYIKKFCDNIYAPQRFSKKELEELTKQHDEKPLTGAELLKFVKANVQHGKVATAQAAAASLEDDPKFADEALIMQARIALRFARNGIEALEFLNQIIAVDDEHGPAHYWAMRAALHEKDFDTATSYAEVAAKFLPRMTRGEHSPFTVLSKYHEQNEDDDARLEILKQQLAIDSFNYVAQRPYALLLYKKGKYAEASKALERCIQFSIYDPRLHAAFGHCQEQLGDKDAAKWAYEIAITLDESEEIAVEGLKRLSD